MQYLISRTDQKPAIAVILGSGLGEFAELIQEPTEISSTTIPSYPVSSVQGHEGKLVFGYLKDQDRTSLPILLFKGRVHFYESGDLASTTFPVQVAHALGARTLLATNAAGGIRRSYSEGDLMLIEDYLNFANLDPLNTTQTTPGSAFDARTNFPLDNGLSRIILESARHLGISLHKGTYCWLRGPSYETKAEIEMLRRLGADAVGMSTVPELMVGARLDMKVAAISLISNMAAGMSENPLSHKEVSETASRVRHVFSSLLKETILRINN